MFKFFKPKPKVKVSGQNNHIELNNLKCQKKQKIKVEVIGNHNQVVFEDMSGCHGDVNIFIYGDHCNIRVAKGLLVSHELKIVCGNQHSNFSKPENISFEIGENTSIEAITMVAYNSGSSISIGQNCIISYNVWIYNTDGHPVYDLETGAIANKVRNLVIGDNVWVGMNATILKNVYIPSGCIVGFGAVVSKSYDIENCVLAGNPAVVVKENIGWARSDVEYIRNK